MRAHDGHKAFPSEAPANMIIGGAVITAAVAAGYGWEPPSRAR